MGVSEKLCYVRWGRYSYLTSAVSFHLLTPVNIARRSITINAIDNYPI